MSDKVQSKSKLAILLALLALSCTAYLAYQSFWGEMGLFNLVEQNNNQQQLLTKLTASNQQLAKQIAELSEQQQVLEDKLHNLNPTQSGLILMQLNSLLSAANQSLILYHDPVAAIKLLNYALQNLASSNDPQFNELKIKISQDLTRLQAEPVIDSTVLATQLEEAILNVKHLSRVASVNLQQPLTADLTWYQRIFASVRNNLLDLVAIRKIKAGASENLQIQAATTVSKEQLELALINARQALLTRNARLWQQSIAEAKHYVEKDFIEDAAAQQELALLDQLQQVHLGNAELSITATMQAWIKLQQLQSGK